MKNALQTAQSGPRTLIWLRVEALAVLALSTGLYWSTGGRWWLFAALLLVPDIAMLFYLLNQKAGSIAYNTVHSYVAALAVLIIAMGGHHNALVPYLLIWIAHIAFDRALGYGLKYPGSFRETHLGLVGKGA